MIWGKRLWSRAPLIRNIWSRLDTKDSHIASCWPKPPCKIFSSFQNFFESNFTELTKLCQLASRKEGHSLRTEIHVLTWKYNDNLRTEKTSSVAWEQKIGLPTKSGTGAMGPLSRSLRPLFNHPFALRPLEHRPLPQCMPPQQRWFSGTKGWGSGNSLLLPILYKKGRGGVG